MSEEKPKVPSHFFQWFESLKQGYENSINRLFNRVEEVNEDHKAQMKETYQAQIEALKKSYQDHLHAIKDSHKAQLNQAQGRIDQLENDTRFYQGQIKTQHQSIDRLNDRYDAVIFALTDKMDSKELENVIKDISPTEFNADQPSLKHQQPESEPDTLTGPLAPQNRKTANPLLNEEETEATPDTAPNTNTDTQTNATASDDKQNSSNVLNQAFEARQAEQFEQAYALFLTAAKSGDAKAMGALGRAHFIGEGIELDKSTGLAWLIKAAELNFAPASKKVQSAKQKTPQLYESAKQIADSLPA